MRALSSRPALALLVTLALLAGCADGDAPAPAGAPSPGTSADVPGGAERGEVAEPAARTPEPGPEPAGDAAAPAPTEEDHRAARLRMVKEQVWGRGVRDRAVIEALRVVPRHAFVPAALAARAYEDGPLPIGEEDALPQPYLVGAMLEALECGPGTKVLELGTGAGYVAAVLAEAGARVCSVEHVGALYERACATLEAQGYGAGRVRVRLDDPLAGWPEEAPFDAILVKGSLPDVPGGLVAQLAPGGVLVVPVGPAKGPQTLVRVRRRPGGRWVTEELQKVRFGPLR